jgi:adenine-specific DNA-methyltransferase
MPHCDTQVKRLFAAIKCENVEEESCSLTRGGSGCTQLRKGRPNSFYAIYVDDATKAVIGVGPHLEADTPYDPNEAPKGCTAFYPVGKDGTERVWRYERNSMMKHIEDGDIVCTPKGTLNVAKHRDVKYDPVFSVWTDGRYNAGTSEQI